MSLMGENWPRRLKSFLRRAALIGEDSPPALQAVGPLRKDKAVNTMGGKLSLELFWIRDVFCTQHLDAGVLGCETHLKSHFDFAAF